jgi:hypothetical protein
VASVKNIFILIALINGLAGCAGMIPYPSYYTYPSTKSIIEHGAVQLTGSEMKTLLSGATVYGLTKFMDGTQQGIIQYSEKHFDDGLFS